MSDEEITSENIEEQLEQNVENLEAIKRWGAMQAADLFGKAELLTEFAELGVIPEEIDHEDLETVPADADEMRQLGQRCLQLYERID